MTPEGARRLASHFRIRRRKALLSAYSLAEGTTGWMGGDPVHDVLAQLQTLLQKPY